MPLDDLVGALEVGDPRIRLKASKVNGRTVLPLTRSHGGVQAWKIIIPASNSEPAPKSHEGHEWLYVLAGRMRLVLGDHDLVLGAARQQSSTLECRTGSGAPAIRPLRSSACSGPRASGSHTKARSVNNRANQN